MTRFYCVLLLALLTGCDEAKVAETSKAPQPAMPTSLVIQVSSHEGSAAHEAAVQFGELVKSLSQGSLEVLPQHPIEHTDERRVLAGLQEGLIDFAVIPSAKMTHIRPELELFNVPFIFSNVEQVHRVYRSQLARQLLELLKQDKLIGLGFWDGGFKQLVTNFPLDSVDDFTGKRFRIMESTLLRQQFEHWGAATTPIAHSLIAEAFQNGDINGCEESLSHIGHHSLEGKRVYMTNHGHQTLLLIMSEKAFYRLTPQQKNILTEAAKEASTLQYIAAERINGKALKTLEAKGVVYQPSPALMASLKQVYDDTLEKNRHVIGTANLEQLLELKQDWENPYPDKLIVALDAAMTGASAKSGLSIRRGIELALEEINANGGLLGKEVVLLARDNTMLPSRGLDNIKRFSQYPNLLAVFSGISSPVVLSEIDLLHEEKMLMLVPWAAATPITSNGQDPSYIFRVSVRDEYAAQFMLDGALSETEDIGLLMVNNGWGRSNYTALQESMQKRGIRPVHTEWFDWGEKNSAIKIKNLIERGAKAIIFVGSSLEGQAFVELLASYPNPPVVFSHWGVTGSDFGQKAANALEKVDFRVLQTFTFVDNDNPLAVSLARRYHERYYTQDSTDIVSPSGTAHAYDLMNMLAIATQRAGKPDMSAIRDELKKIDAYSGLMKQYQRPFLNDPQDALKAEDYLFAFYKDGTLYPKGSDAQAE